MAHFFIVNTEKACPRDYLAIQNNLAFAGVCIHDKPFIVHAGLVTSRSPDDLDAFNEKIVEEICEGRHAEQSA